MRVGVTLVRNSVLSPKFMESQLRNPEEYKSVDDFCEAIRTELLGQDRCPNACLGFMQVDMLGSTVAFRQCLTCGFFDYATHPLPLQLRAVAEA